MVWTGLIWLRIGTSGGLFWTRQWTFGFHEMVGGSWVAAHFGFHEMVGGSSVAVHFGFHEMVGGSWVAVHFGFHEMVGGSWVAVHFGFHEMVGGSRVAVHLVASQEGLSSVSEWAIWCHVCIPVPARTPVLGSDSRLRYEKYRRRHHLKGSRTFCPSSPGLCISTLRGFGWIHVPSVCLVFFTAVFGIKYFLAYLIAVCKVRKSKSTETN
jgi:hypothetical protein